VIEWKYSQERIVFVIAESYWRRFKSSSRILSCEMHERSPPSVRSHYSLYQSRWLAVCSRSKCSPSERIRIHSSLWISALIGGRPENAIEIFRRLTRQGEMVGSQVAVNSLRPAPITPRPRSYRSKIWIPPDYLQSLAYLVLAPLYN